MSRKRVYLQPPFLMHACHNRLVRFPPSGYEFVVRETAQEKTFRVATRMSAVRGLLRSSDLILPTTLAKSWLEKWNKPPSGTALTYASEHLVLRSEPWVVDMEFAHLFAGRHPKHLKRYRRVIQGALASPHCRRIICWSEAARSTLLDLDMQHFEHKIEVVYNSIEPKNFVKEYGNGKKIKILFVGADALTNAWEAFEYKGGREVLATFSILRHRYNHLELVVRSNPPPDVRTKYEGMDGLRIIDKFILRGDLEEEYRTADIFLMPSHTTIFMTLLEAMSFELPVVTIDSWSNAEHIEDGKTGLVVPRSKRLPYYYPGTLQTNFGTPEYDRAMKDTDPDVVGALARAVALLIENPETRTKMGKEARREVERGRFSLGTINDRLSRILDKAIHVQEEMKRTGEPNPA